MPEEPRSEVARAEDRDDWQVLNLLIDEQRPWSVEEITREYSDRLAAVDALARLDGAGLIHRTSEGFVFVTRAAARFYEIAE